MTHQIEALVALVTAPFPAFLIVLIAGTIAWTAYVERRQP